MCKTNLKTKILLLILIIYSANNLFSQEYYQIKDKVLTKEKLDAKLNKLKNELQQKNLDTVEFSFYYKILNSFFRNDSLINDIEIVEKTLSKKNLFNEKIFALKGKELPEFQLKDLDGNTVTSESLKGKVTFINLWFTSCPPCIKEIPQLASLKKKYGDKVNFVAITFNSSYKVKAFLDKHKEFNYTHLVDAREYLYDTLDNKSFPKNIILNKENKLIYIDNGIPVSETKVESKAINEIENLIDSLL